MTGSTAFPTKLFYKIHEVAAIVGVEPYVLRYWETKFPMLRPERYGNDERRYRRRDVEMLLRIRRLLYVQKFTIAGAVERLRKDPHGALEAEFVDCGNEVPAAAQQDVLAAPPRVAGPVVMPLEALFDASPLERLRQIRAELRELSQHLGG